jgi:hypothetical protein
VDSGFRVFRIRDLSVGLFELQGSGVEVSNSNSRVRGLGFRGFRFRV